MRWEHPGPAILLRLAIASLLVLPLACTRGSASGPEPIAYDREPCERCGMLISDPRYAAEVRLAGERHVHKFDDLGDALAWLAEHGPEGAASSVGEEAAEVWVRDVGGSRWIDATTAHYSRGAGTPMDFGFAAHAQPIPDGIDFGTVRREVARIVAERRRGS